MVEFKDFIDFFKFLTPSIVMLIVVVYLVGGHFRDNEKRQKMKIILDNKKLITPLRLQAYERLVLFLERITPESLLMRSPNYPNKTNDEQHSELLNSIRSEFEHNLSQQLYVSAETWNSVKNAKNFTISMINNVAKNLDNKAPATQLSRKILDAAMELEQPITEKALNQIKREIQQLF